ncbi:MAG: phosphoglucosamine mutase [Alphaproteobacteria bacterium]|nr:phosphoglucosamine mutase [Alphaproteobacteria bacterium]
MGTLFGTDGVRGKANVYPMTPDLVQKVGMAAGSLFQNGKHRHRVVIGKDTRLSGYLFEPALTSGFIAAGMDVMLVGPMPTPAVAMLTKSLRADLGVMISASHNPYQDNGIKLFDSHGLKISDEMEKTIEDMILGSHPIPMAPSEELGRAKRLDDARGRYIEVVKRSFPKGLRLKGLKIVIDCANGAAYHLGKTILWELGADVIEMGIYPDGTNINQGCGSTHPEAMCAMVKQTKADIGLALDGDADRLIVCDENGQIIDGDQLMALIATYWKELGKLTNNGIVATIMSNMGLEKYLHTQGLAMQRTPVGDRFVAQHMREFGYNLGGEQSGHIILSDYTTTGDGLIAALQILAVLVQKNQKASTVLNVFDPFPQILKNVRFQHQNPLTHDHVQKTIKEAESLLAGKGRLLVRKSGTEPLLRVMAEAEDLDLVDQSVKMVVTSIEEIVNRHG